MQKYDDNKIIELKKQGYSWKRIAEVLGYESGERLRWYARRSDWYKEVRTTVITNNTIDEMQSHTTMADGSISSTIKTRLSEQKKFTKDELLELHGFDSKEFQIKTVTSNEWSMTNGAGDKYYNFQSKIIAEPIKGIGELTERLESLINKFTKPFAIESRTVSNPDKSLIIPLADSHMGINTAEEYKHYQDKMLALMDKPYRTIIISLLGDLFNTNDFKNQTIHGTRVADTDTPQAWEEACKYIEPLIQKAIASSIDVRVIYSRGNHDETIAWAFAKYLEVKYPQIDIDVSMNQLKCSVIDDVAVYFTHGHIKRRNITQLCAALYPKEWGNTTKRLLFTGHWHTLKTEDKAGIIHYQLPTTSKHTDYEEENLFMGNENGIHCYELSNNKVDAIFYL